MNKLSRIISAGVLTLGFLCASVAVPALAGAQAASGNGIKVSPVRTDVTIGAGESKTINMSVQNITSTDATFEAIINDFVPQGEQGQPALILDADKYAPSHSLKRYIAAVPNIAIKAGETKEVKVTINVPSDASGGGYYGAVRFTPVGESGGKNVLLSASVGSIILVRVPGDIKEDMVASSFDVRRGANGVGGSKFFTTNKDLYAVVRFENRGNVHEQPFGKIQVLKGDKVIQETEINATDPRGNVLPDSIRRFDTKLEKIGMFGKYTVRGNFGYGDKGQLISANTSFWVIPLPLIIAVVVLLVLIIAAILGVPKMIRNYNQRVLRKAGRR